MPEFFEDFFEAAAAHNKNSTKSDFFEALLVFRKLPGNESFVSDYVISGVGDYQINHQFDYIDSLEIYNIQIFLLYIFFH